MAFKKFNSTYFVVISLFTFAFFSRCAQPAAPMGGPRDTIAPILLDVTPPNYSTNFKAKEVVFTFNEYLQLKDVQKEVLISPPIMPRPIFAVKGKSIVMKFPPETKLDSNTTYKVDFGNSIQDNNEGNPAKRFEYIFSTGNKVDSLVMSGKLVDALTGADVINGFVLYYGAERIPGDTTLSDSTIFKGKKLSIARTDSTGNFLATNLKHIPYRIFAIKDENGNQDYDMGGDLVGLSNTLYNPETMKEFDVWVDPVKDRIEVTPQIKFELFKETRRLKQSLKEVTRPKKHQLQLVFAADSVHIEDIIIDSVAREDIIIENNTFNDSIRVWVRSVGENVKLPDSLKGVVRYYSVDSIGASKIDTTVFALNYFNKADEKTGAEKAAEKFNTTFKKIGDWLKRLFMGKKKKLAIARAQQRRYVADSLKRIQADSVALVMRQDSMLKADSLEQRYAAGLEIRRDSSKIFKPSFSSTSEMAPTNELFMISELPLDKIDTSKIEIVRLSFEEKGEDDFNLEDADKKEKVPTVRTKQQYTISQNKEDITKYKINVDWLPLSEYQIVVNRDALQDISGAVNDSLGVTIKMFDPVKYSRVVLDIKSTNKVEKHSYIVSLLDSTNNVVAVKNIVGDGKLIFDYLTPKSYKLKFVDDKNGNGVQDIGSVLQSIEPERVEIFSPRKGVELFPTKENWDIEYEIYPEKIFNPDLVIPDEKKPEEEKVEIKEEEKNEK